MNMPENKNRFEEPLPDYEKAEMSLLKEALNRSYKERFQMATLLYKVQKTMGKAVITHKPFIEK